MLFMGVSVPDAANVCNESKVESYDTDIKYCPEFYAENEKENTTESDSDINSDILEDDSVIGSLNEITKDKSDVTFYDIYESLKSGDVDSTIDMALKVFSDSVIYEVRTSRGLALQIIAVIVLGSTFAQLAGNMGEYVSAHGFMVTYMVLLSLLLGDFVLVQSIVQDGVHESVLSHVCLVCVICERPGECRIFTVGHNPGDIHLPECDNKVHTPPHQMRRAHSTHK